MDDGNLEEGVAKSLSANEQCTNAACLITNLLSWIPAKALYQAKNAAKKPNRPPVFCRAKAAVALPKSLAYCSMARNKKHRSRVKKRRKKATVDRRVQRRMMVVKMNQPVKKKPSTLATLPAYGPSGAVMPHSGVKRMPYESQKPPYELRAVAPKVLPAAISLETYQYSSNSTTAGSPEVHNLPHASEQLNKTAITKGEGDHDVRGDDASSVHVDA